MNIPKAIEILDDCTKGALLGISQDTKDALDLSIEALKLVQRERLLSINPVETQLPGETKD